MNMRIRIVNGPNLASLGMREPGIYGRETLDDIVRAVTQHAASAGASVEHFQSDVEGELVRHIGSSRGMCDGIIINPAAYTHTSVAVRDAISACGLPCVEVHLSNTHSREPFRHVSLTVPVCIGQIMGFGGFGYILAFDAIAHYLNHKR
jgi:3-dehydroquinate dehydratase-2